jgi:hypothetical protein
VAAEKRKLIAEGKAYVEKDGINRLIPIDQLDEYVNYKGYVEVTEEELRKRAVYSGLIKDEEK